MAEIAKVLYLTEKEVKLLSELLSLDLNHIGFDDKEAKVLNGVYNKLDEK